MRSVSDVLSAAQNIATGLSAISQSLLNITGVRNAVDISTTTLVFPNPGRVCTVIVTTAGTTAGSVYDSNTTSVTTGKVFVIPNTLGVTVLNFPVATGILVVPGTGQIVSISYS
jgi:hypothetical protein